MALPWGTILGVLLKIIGFGLDRVGASVELKKSFRDFVDKMDGEKLISARVKKEWEIISDKLEHPTPDVKKDSQDSTK